MNNLAEFFLQNISIVYFFYGLSFFSMGLAVFIEVSHSSDSDFAKALRYLAFFGIIHGSHEWLEMLLLSKSSSYGESLPTWIGLLRVVLLSISFLALVTFGTRLLAGYGKKINSRVLIGAITAIWLLGLAWVALSQPHGSQRLVSADVYTRYALAIPGAVLTAWGLILQCRQYRQHEFACFGRELQYAALAFIAYGAFGQLFATPSAIFPSTFLNMNTFVRWFGIPVQVFRAAMAALIAIFIIRFLRSYEQHKQRKVDELSDARLRGIRHLEALRAELLHRTVKAQESERQRIARELHDETGQTLTALGMGLRGLSEMVNNNPQRAIEQANQLELLAVSGIDELQRLVTGLRPPQLDDLGLLAALRWYAKETSKVHKLPIKIESKGERPRLPQEISVVFFRIAQEAITNAVRHAQASSVNILLENADKLVRLVIRDDGKGFNVDEKLSANTNEQHWGLLGIQERATLLEGECIILSQPGSGTQIEVWIEKSKFLYETN